MGWKLLPDGSSSTAFELPQQGTAHVINDNGVRVVLTLQMQTELARIEIGPYGAKLEAVNDALIILPGHTSTVGAAVDPRTKGYELQPRTGKYSEAILFRHGDILNFPKYIASFVCQWTESEVQVSSSVTDAVQVADSAEVDGVAETPEEEAEDEDLDNTLTAAPLNHTKYQPRATPQLSNQRSVVVVQETPTAARVNGETDYADAPEIADNSTEPVEDTPSSSPAPAGHGEPEPEAEAYSTARTGESQGKRSARGPNLLSNASAFPTIDASTTGMDGVIEEIPSRQRRTNESPQMQIPQRPTRKRATPIIEEDDVEAESKTFSRANKRTKRSDDDTQDSRMSNIDVEVAPPRKTATKAKNRQSEVVKAETVAETEEATPNISQRSSQRSATSISAEPYEGPTPRVAFSNSAILSTGTAVKFLKKQRGTYVENLSDDFNVLCAKDGEIRKTSKVLLAIAQGVPIVIDEWLLDSAKATQFLSVTAYKLSAPRQEKEWKFQLDDVWSQPQTPFEGYSVHFTKSLKAFYHPFTEIEAVCKAAGARSTTSTRMNKTGDTIVLALDDEDPEAQKLMQDGVTCYHRDLIAYSILRGALDLDSDEFRIDGAAAAEAPKEKKRKGRKST